MKKIILSALALTLFASCQKDELSSSSSSTAVQFGAAEIVTTRVADDQWELYDEIGIYAYDENSVEGEYTSSNFQYITYSESTSSALFEAVSYKITYIPGVTNYFFAYYPYSKTAGSEYSIDVSSQSTLSDIDFMVSDIEEGSDDVDDIVLLEFNHQLSYVELVIDLADGLSAADLESVTIQGVATEGSYSFAERTLTVGDGVGSIDMNISVDASTITARAILIPSTSGFGLEFNFADKTFTSAIGEELKSGYKYNYTTSLSYSEVTLSSSNITPWGGGVTVDVPRLDECLDWEDMAANEFEGGTGSELDPYIIDNAFQLAYLSKLIVEEDYYSSGKYFKLSSDIDLTTVWGAKWTPIGYNSFPIAVFSGNFDGDGHTVTLGINNEDTDFLYSALFGCAEGATISNLTIEGSVVSVGWYAAGLVAYGGNVTIVNCVNNADVTNICESSARGDAAGIVGRIETASIVENCENSGNITSVYRAGGIVSHASFETGITLNKVSNSGSITVDAESANSYSGGILGVSFASEITIINASNSGDIKSYTAYTQAFAGGICGARDHEADDTATLIYNCSNTGSVESEAAIFILAGGILGGSEYGSSSVSIIGHCYNAGEIKGDQIGAIMGGSYTIQLIEYCYFSEDCGASVASYNSTTPADYTESYSTTYMKGADFVSELNEYVTTYNDGSPAYPALYWSVDYEDVNGGYPLLK